MAPIQLKYVVSFSSQDSKHPVENLLDLNSCKRWMSPASEKSGRLEAEFQLDRACLISHVDIGTYFVFSVQMLVGRSSWPSSQEFRSLLPSSTFMTPDECRSGKNKISIRMFKKDNFDQSVAAEKWDRLRIICSQPFRKDVQFGLSLLKVVADEDQDTLANGDLNSSLLSARRTSSDLAAQNISSPLASYFTSPSPDSVISKSLSSSRSSLTSGPDSSLSRAGQLLKAATGRVIQYKPPSTSLPMKSDEDCTPSGIAPTPSPSSKGKPAATPTRTNGMTLANGILSAPSNGVVSTPKHCVTSATKNGLSVTPINSVTSTPKNSVTSTPKNSVTSTPKNGVTSIPKNSVTSTPKNSVTSTPKNSVTSTPKNVVASNPQNSVSGTSTSCISKNGIATPRNGIAAMPTNDITSVLKNDPRYSIAATPTDGTFSDPKIGNIGTPLAPRNCISTADSGPKNGITALARNGISSFPASAISTTPKNGATSVRTNGVIGVSTTPIVSAPGNLTTSTPRNGTSSSKSTTATPTNVMTSASRKQTSAKKKKKNGDSEKAIKEFLAKIDYSKLDLETFQISDLRHQFEKTIFRKLSKDEKKFFMLTARLNVGSFVVSDDENLDDLESSAKHLGSPSVNSSYGKKSSIDTPAILKETAAILKETPAVLKTQNSCKEMVKNDSFECHNLSECSNDDTLMPFLPVFKTPKANSMSVSTNSNSKHITVDGNHNQLINVGAAHKKASVIDNGASVKKSGCNISSLDERASPTNILKSAQKNNLKQSITEKKNAKNGNQTNIVGQTVSLPTSATETKNFTSTSNSNQNTAKQPASLPRSATETKTSTITLNQNTVQQSASLPHGKKSKQKTPRPILPHPSNNPKVSASPMSAIPNRKQPVSMPRSATETFSTIPPSNHNNIKQSTSLPQFTTMTKNLNPASGPASFETPLSARIGGNILSSARPTSANPGGNLACPSTPTSIHIIKPADAQKAANRNTAIPPNARPGGLSKPGPLPSASSVNRPPPQTVGQDPGRSSGIQPIHISDSDDSDSLINPTKKRKRKNKKKQSKRSRIHPPVVPNSTQSTACGESSSSVSYSTGSNQFTAGPSYSSVGATGNTETCPICQGKFPRETFDGHAYRCGELAMTNDVVQLSRRASFSRGLSSQASSNGQDVECPLCLRMFPSYFVEIHASECSQMTF